MKNVYGIKTNLKYKVVNYRGDRLKDFATKKEAREFIKNLEAPPTPIKIINPSNLGNPHYENLIR